MTKLPWDDPRVYGRQKPPIPILPKKPDYSIEPWFLGEKCAQSIITNKKREMPEGFMNAVRDCVISKGGTLKDYEAWAKYNLERKGPPIPFVPPWLPRTTQFPWGTIIIAMLALMLLRRS